MNAESLLRSMVGDLWGDLQAPGVELQVAVLLACLALAWWGSRHVLRRWQAAQAAQAAAADSASASTAAGDVSSIPVSESASHAAGESASAAVTDGGAASRAPAPRLRLLQTLRSREAMARILFPAYALGLLLIAIPLVSLTTRTHLLRLAAVLLLAAALVRSVVFAISTLTRSPMLVAFERALVSLIWGSVVLRVTGYSHEVIDLLNSVEFPVGKQTLTLWTVMSGTFWVVLTVLLGVWLGGVVEMRLLAGSTLDSSLRAVLSRVIRALFLLVAVLLGFSLVGIDLTALSVFGGAIGVGVGLGLQKIASNYISGFVVLLERRIRLGDQIRIDSVNVQGEVSDIKTRFTVIAARNGVTHIVPNELLIASPIQNLSLSGRMRLTLPMVVAYGTDLDQAFQSATAAAVATPRVLATPEPAVLLTKFDPDGIAIELSFSIGDPNLGQNNVISDVARAMWRDFSAAGIQRGKA